LVKNGSRWKDLIEREKWLRYLSPAGVSAMENDSMNDIRKKEKKSKYREQKAKTQKLDLIALQDGS
ncbi:hypothetical protein scyTo_0024466, partial [Scyliorhinus torazame]|nr:hypothetical protein [Scyliorhinus torazame]